jgi:hypothetical protein
MKSMDGIDDIHSNFKIIKNLIVNRKKEMGKWGYWWTMVKEDGIKTMLFWFWLCFLIDKNYSNEENDFYNVKQKCFYFK